jgi:membrane protein DedA with SNARE-associated domain/rhodanese-related sulfurtransferase
MSGLDAALYHYGAGIIFVVTLLARLGAPIPAAPLIIVAGAVAARGGPSLWWVIVCASLASLAGDGAWFLGGRRYGYRVLRMLCRISLSPDSCVRQSEALIGRWGGWSLIAAKFLPGLSAVAAPMAGALGMAGGKFIAFQTIGSVLWASTFAGVGIFFRNDVAAVLEAISDLGIGAVASLLLLAAGYLAWRYVRRQLDLRDAGIPRIDVGELVELLASGEGPLLVDVRPPAIHDLDARRIPGAVSVELAQIRTWARELPRNREIVVYCNCPNEASAARASRMLLKDGFLKVRPLGGGLDAWASAGHDIESVSGMRGNLEPRAAQPSRAAL